MNWHDVFSYDANTGFLYWRVKLPKLNTDSMKITVRREVCVMETYIGKSWKDLYDRIKELEAENARLRQQRDAANAQLDWLLEQPELSNDLVAKIQES